VQVREPSVEPVLTVIVPVVDQESVIAKNVRVIRERVAAGLDGPFEIIVVSDGSLDRTAERVLESQIPNVKVLHYDRNLGKGYAVKTGAREARGRWIGYVDADLDLDPVALSGFVARGERDGLDFVIGSKRHPDSRVHYPRSRVVASWLYQQLVRVLFQLHVTDTQVGIKVFRAEVAHEVMPLLLVKRYAFDVELLAVSRALGYGRIGEMPVVLDYQFTGSGVRSIAVLIALVDTVAVFYRLRLRRFYQRRGARSEHAVPHRTESAASVTVIDADDVAVRRARAEAAGTEVLAFLDPGSRPSANLLTAAEPFFARPDLAAVVTPQLTPAGTDTRHRAANAIAESRLGSGSLYYRFTPGGIRLVSDFPARSFLVRRSRFLELPASTLPEAVVLELVERGGSALYLPEASVTIPPTPLFRPHLRRVAAYGRSRAALIRRRGLDAVRLSTIAVAALAAWALLGWLLVFAGTIGLEVWLTVWLVYAAWVVVAAAIGGLRFRSFRVVLLTAAGLPLTHATYAVSFLSGLAVPRRGARP
jgi:Glycosyl transferase family 2